MAYRRASRSLCGFALALAVWLQAAAETVRVGGTGAATEPFRRIGAHLADAGLTVEVIPGLGSAGGISAASQDVLQVVVSGRALSEREQALGLTTALTVCTPYVFVSSHPAPGSLDHRAIGAIYAEAAPKWPDGTPVRVILRPKAESDNATMAALFPGTGQGIAQARTRDSIPIGATDQDNADLAEHVPGSLTGTTYAQIVTERRDLRFVAIDGVPPGIEAMESGRYPFAKPLYIVTARHPASDTVRFLDFLLAPDGESAMREAGIVPCPK